MQFPWWTRMRLILVIALCIVICTVGILFFISFSPEFGGSPDKESLNKIESSPNYKEGIFVNKIPTSISTVSENSPWFIASIRWMLFPPKDKNPIKPLPSKKFTADKLIKNSFVWLWHSTLLFDMDNTIIMIDPIFSNASPIPWTIKGFPITEPSYPEDLPSIDVVLISHDHYDHLDYQTIEIIHKNVELFLVPLGIKSHLLRRWVDDNKIQEYDRYEDTIIKDINFTLVPARHFSGRWLTNRSSTLWWWWIVSSDNTKIYLWWDGGYSDEFAFIGENYGPFDISFLENGAYNDDWTEIHMRPEQTVQANIDLQSKVLFPIHWGKFDLSSHSWDEPILRLLKASEENNVAVATPLIGEVFTLQNIPKEEWWKR